jgi:carbon storage regulator
MLVITRKTDESIVITVPSGEEVEITVLEAAKDRARLGIKAAREVKIMRSELILAQSSNVEAAQAVSKAALEGILKFMK